MLSKEEAKEKREQRERRGREEARQEDRVTVSLPVDISHVGCITRDLSSSAVFLEMNASFNTGEKVGFAIDLDSPGGKLVLKCTGEVVRIERRDGKIGAAVKIVESVMESAGVSIITESNNVLSSSCKTATHLH